MTAPANPETVDIEFLKRVIAWANNSLWGSHGFFLSTDGGPPDEHHLDRAIEKIKSYAHEQRRRAEVAEAALSKARGETP